MRGQVAARAVGLLLGFEATLNPFMLAPAWTGAARPADAPSASPALRRDDVRRTLVEQMAADPKAGPSPAGA